MAGQTDRTAPSERIERYIASVTDWRGDILARLRALILEAEPRLVEEWKWNSPVWSLKSPVVSISAFKPHVKAAFLQGASLQDAHGLFNAGLEAKTSRGIDFKHG